MAIAKEIWEKARLLFEHGKPLNDIAKELGINKGSISRKSKQENWTKNSELATLVADDVANIIMGNEIATQKATLATEELRLHNREVVDQLRRKNLVYGASEEILKLSSKMAKSNSKQVVVKVKEYSKENGSSESLDKIDVELDASDLKNLSDAVDKSSITLNVNERHAPKAITALQVNTGEEKPERLGMDDFYKEVGNG